MAALKKIRKKYFDDYIWYDPKNDKIWIGRPDVKWGNKPWQWHIISSDTWIQGPVYKVPKNFVEIDRVEEMSLFDEVRL